MLGTPFELLYARYEKSYPGEFYNIGGTETRTISEMLDFLISISTCKNITIQADPSRIRPLDADAQIRT